MSGFQDAAKYNVSDLSGCLTGRGRNEEIQTNKKLSRLSATSGVQCIWGENVWVVLLSCRKKQAESRGFWDLSLVICPAGKLTTCLHRDSFSRSNCWSNKVLSADMSPCHFIFCFAFLSDWNYEGRVWTASSACADGDVEHEAIRTSSTRSG